MGGRQERARDIMKPLFVSGVDRLDWSERLRKERGVERLELTGPF